MRKAGFENPTVHNPLHILRPSCAFLTRITSHLLRLRADSKGNVAVMTGLLLVPLVGTLGVGFEISNWYLNKHAMQDAADAAVIAAVRGLW